MSKFVPNSHDSREVLLHYFISKKTAAESRHIFVKVYGEHALSEITCRDWSRRFKSGDFDLSNTDCGKPSKKFEDAELQALLNEDSTQTLKQLAKALEVDRETISRRLHTIVKIQKEGKKVPNELKDTLKGEKPLVKFCLIVPKESHFYIVLLLAMKSGSISTISSTKNRGGSAALGRRMPWTNRLFSISMKGKILNFLHEVEKMISVISVQI